MSEKTGENRLNIRGLIFAAIILITGVFYFFILGDGSYAMYADSETFIEWSYGAPLKDGYVIYVNFLKTCRTIFGEGLYLQAVNIIQCLLAFITAAALEEYVRKSYGLNYVMGYITFLAICGVYGYSLPEVVASHYIVTEGLTFPLFILMSEFLLKYINERSFFYLAFVFGINFVMASIRPQMIFFLPILILIVAVNEITVAAHRKEKVRAGNSAGDTTGQTENSRRGRYGMMAAIPALILLSVVCMYLTAALTVTLFSGRNNSQYHEAVTGKVMCVMRPEDESFQEEGMKEGYRLLYEDTYERGGLTENFPSSLLEYEKVQRIIDDNMKKGINIIWSWYNERYEPLERHDIHEFRNRIIAPELKAHKTEYIGVILRLLPSSLVSSIFIQPPQYRLICNLIAFGLYIAAIVLIYAAYSKGVDRKYYIPMSISLIMIYGNALLSNMVLYGQQRYMVYCFGIFYMSFLIIYKGLKIRRSGSVSTEG